MPKTKDQDISDSSFVVQLTDAEKRAREVIEDARRRKAIRLKKAREDSTKEIEDFRKLCDDNLDKLNKDHTLRQATNAIQFEKDLQAKRIELGNAYTRNFTAAYESVLDKMLDVKAELHKNLRD